MKTRRIRNTLFAAVALVVLVRGRVLASDPLTIQVLPAVAFEPATLALNVTVERNAENRKMEVSLDSSAYFRSSLVQIDGEDSPRVTSMHFSHVPAGSYEVTVILFGPGDKRRATMSRHVEVLGRSTD